MWVEAGVGRHGHAHGPRPAQRGQKSQKSLPVEGVGLGGLRFRGLGCTVWWCRISGV